MVDTEGIANFAKLLTARGGAKRSGVEALPTIEDVRLAARRRVPKMIFDFVDGGAGRENTLRANEADLDKVTFRAKTLVDVSGQDTSRTVGGRRFDLPLVLGPAGLVRVVGNGGELSAVKAAGARGLPYTISTSSAYSIEEIANVATGPLWFQLYLWRSRAVVKDLVDRARSAGCTTLVLTVDVPVAGNRTRDLRNGMSIPPKVTVRNAFEAARRPRWLSSMLDGPAIGFRNIADTAQGDSALSHSEFINRELANLRATWEDLAWLREQWGGTLYVKGITTSFDARLAVAAGADGVVVSNHGGRQLDSLPSTISVLSDIVAEIGDRAEVLIDGGFRTGEDVIKALAMGARAVLLGRPWVFGVAAGAERGVARVLDIFDEEMKLTLALLGSGSVDDLDASCISVPPAWIRGNTVAQDA
jgi:isopentenyl diphosphate isomerase/L-lactate dehydrogenase-like FMN-dependent dehydrogenase